MPLTGVAGLAGLVPYGRRRRHRPSAIPENERANVMSTLKQNALDGPAERRPAHTGSTGGPPLKPSTPQGSAQGAVPAAGSSPAAVGDITRPSPAMVGEYDHVAAARTMVNGGFRQLPVADGTGWIGTADIADVGGALLAPPAA
jgi:hypothetical protein